MDYIRGKIAKKIQTYARLLIGKGYKIEKFLVWTNNLRFGSKMPHISCGSKLVRVWSDSERDIYRKQGLHPLSEDDGFMTDKIDIPLVVDSSCKEGEVRAVTDKETRTIDFCREYAEKRVKNADEALRFIEEEKDEPYEIQIPAYRCFEKTSELNKYNLRVWQAYPDTEFSEDSFNIVGIRGTKATIPTAKPSLLKRLFKALKKCMNFMKRKRKEIVWQRKL